MVFPMNVGHPNDNTEMQGQIDDLRSRLDEADAELTRARLEPTSERTRKGRGHSVTVAGSPTSKDGSTSTTR